MGEGEGPAPARRQVPDAEAPVPRVADAPGSCRPGHAATRAAACRVDGQRARWPFGTAPSHPVRRGRADPADIE